MLKFRNNFFVKQVSEGFAQMCSLNAGVPKLEIERGTIDN